MTAKINGVEVPGQSMEETRVAAVRELLRQRAVATGLLEGEASDDGRIDAAMEALLTREVEMPAPDEEECRRYYESNPGEFISGELIHARHILFQVTSGTPVDRLRAHAEETLNKLHADPGQFESFAREFSNCPSGQHGGNLGQLGRGDTVPEFERALFRLGPTGLLRDVVKTRFGFHIVSVDQRIPGRKLPFEIVHDQIAKRLNGAVEEKALRQYVSVLAAQAEVEGVDLDAASSPLVQ